MHLCSDEVRLLLLALPSKMRACGFGTLQQPLQVDQGGGKEGKGSLYMILSESI